MSDADRKTEAAKKRLAETQEELSAEAATKVGEISKFAFSDVRFSFLPFLTFGFHSCFF